jgi:hypothetical protein
VRRYRETSGAQHAIAREQDETLAMLVEGLRFDWLAVNGADFRTRLYPASGLRPMADIDLLMRPADRSAAGAWLQSLGLLPVTVGEHRIDVAFRRPGSPFWIDLYDRFIQSQRLDLDYEEVWRDREIGPDRLPRMALHHALAVQALRTANEQFVTHLRRFLDLWLLTRDAAVVRAALACACRWKMRRAMYTSIALMRRLLPETASEEWSGDVDAIIDARTRARLDQAVLHGAPYERLPSRPVQIRRKLLLIDTPAHRVRFVAAHTAGLAARAFSRGQAPVSST